MTPLGLQLAVAVLLISLSAAGCYGYLLPLQDRIGVLQKELRLLRERAAVPVQTIQKTVSVAEDVASFYSEFPNDSAMPELMRKLYSAAFKQNLALEQGDYKLVASRDKKLRRYEIELPVKGGYPQIQQFVAHALDELPSLSLDSIVFSRQKISDPLVETQLRFTLYMRES